MAAHTFQNFDSGYWMQNPPNFTNNIYNGVSDEYSYDQAPRQWQFYDQNNFGGQNYVNVPTPPPQNLTPHRRALSNSTSTSFASNRSPYNLSHQFQYQQNNFDNAYFDTPYTPYDAYPSHQQYLKPHQHLPTPSHTPTYEWQMPGERGLSRRRSGVDTDPVQAAHKAMRPILTGHSSSVGDFAPEVPATPHGTSQEDEHANPPPSALRRVPNFDRTMSDIYQDELYNPNGGQIAPAPASSMGNGPSLLSPYRQIVTERIQAANEARSTQSPQSGTRATSPFRAGSPFAPPIHGYGPIGTAAAQRQQQKAESDAIAYHQHHAPMEDLQPKTISPKDAVLEYQDDNYDGPPLFPQSSNVSNVSESSTFEGTQPMYGPINGSKSNKPNNNFAYPTAPASANPAYSHPPPQFRAVNTSTSSQEQQDYPAHLVSMETSRSDAGSESPVYDRDQVKQEYGVLGKPSNTKADTGSYSCPYSGCTQRFPTAALLQKHKREGHRASAMTSLPPSSTTPTGTSASMSPGPSSATATTPSSIPAPPHSPESAASIAARNQLAGPHRCDRINPSTGKPCNTVFSRPYDLTRHEDTIHGQRTKVKCQYCTEEKTFSRNDALTRHMRVVHPNVDFAGKHGRRRGGPLEG